MIGLRKKISKNRYILRFCALVDELNMEEYSFSQTTLEQVFLKFAHLDEEDGVTDVDAANDTTGLVGGE